MTLSFAHFSTYSSALVYWGLWHVHHHCLHYKTPPSSSGEHNKTWNRRLVCLCQLEHHQLCGSRLVIYMGNISFLTDKIKRIIIPNLTCTLWESEDICMWTCFVNCKVLWKWKGGLWSIYPSSPTFTQAWTHRLHSWKCVWHVEVKAHDQ